jgi:hypothetical protein
MATHRLIVLDAFVNIHSEAAQHYCNEPSIEITGIVVVIVCTAWN